MEVDKDFITRVVEAVAKIHRADYERYLGAVENIAERQRQLEADFRVVEDRTEADAIVTAIRKLVKVY